MKSQRAYKADLSRLLYETTRSNRSGLVHARLQWHVQQQWNKKSVCTPDINSLPLDNMSRMVTVLQKIMTEFNGAVSEEAKIMVITKTKLRGF
jgi:hypothetical protein